jgi:O-antigen/teichoic acid export membrane protein
MLNYLTAGKPYKVIWSFSIPLLLSTALQQLYNIANSVIVGKFAGSGSLAAVGAAYPITLFFIAVATGSTMGCSVVISQLFGAKKLREMKSAVYTAIFSLGLLGLAMACLGMCLSRPLMSLLNANAEIYDRASAYLFIYSAGVIPCSPTTRPRPYSRLGRFKAAALFSAPIFGHERNTVIYGGEASSSGRKRRGLVHGDIPEHGGRSLAFLHD